MQFRAISDPPTTFCPCLVQRDMKSFLTINGKVHHGLTERRSELIIAFHSGARWIGREEHWKRWVAIPSENSDAWKSAKVFIPESSKPVLVILAQPVVFPHIKVSPGLHFGLWDDRHDQTWRIYQRHVDARDNTNKSWLDIGARQISSWLELPKLDERFHTN
jgi:hypothetical protein